MGRQFNSTSDRLLATTFTMPTTGSLSLWLYPTWAQTDSVDHWLYSIADATLANYMHIIKYSDNVIYAGWNAGSTDYRASVSSGSYTLNQNAWNNFILTWDDTANETRLYLNGTEIATNTSSLATFDTSSQTLILGNIRSDITAIDLASDLAEVAVWSRVLNSGERATLQASPPSAVTTNLEHYWPLLSDLVDAQGSENLTDENTGAGGHPSFGNPYNYYAQQQ